MTVPALTGMNTLLPAGQGFEFVEEVAAGQGIVDLLAVQFDAEAVAARRMDDLDAVIRPLRVRTLDALHSREWVSVDRLASFVGSKPKALKRSTLTPLADAGLVELEGPMTRSTGRWHPLAARLVGVELKLNKWRDAVRQADNAAWCCDHAWVVLDAARAQTALGRLEYFRSFGVGLALLEGSGQLRVVSRPRRRRQVRWLRSLVGELAWQRLSS